MIEIDEDWIVTVNSNIYYQFFWSTLYSVRQSSWWQISLWWVTVRLCVSPQNWTKLLIINWCIIPWWWKYTP